MVKRVIVPKCRRHGVRMVKYKDYFICPKNTCFYRVLITDQEYEDHPHSKRKPLRETTYRRKVLNSQRKKLKGEYSLSKIKEEQRGIGDYGGMVHVTKGDAEQAIRAASEFLQAIKVLLGK